MLLPAFYTYFSASPFHLLAFNEAVAETLGLMCERYASEDAYPVAVSFVVHLYMFAEERMRYELMDEEAVTWFSTSVNANTFHRARGKSSGRVSVAMATPVGVPLCRLACQVLDYRLRGNV